jgi:hypothetical protein
MVCPVLVAPSSQSAEGAKNSRRVSPASQLDLRVEAGKRGGAGRVDVRVERKVKRGALVFCRESATGPVGKTSRRNREVKREEGVLNQIRHYRQVEETLNT